ncbi:MAG: hypothetical protein A2Y21_07235 [Clostridiales bacterium GWC2_40_7]|nr:MAG: hypothetical protein A2Y21_07235 [Clostridiales bacterium GWC2_40_7]
MDFQKNPSKEYIVNEIRKEEIPIIIFGAGIVGEILSCFCKKEGIKIECFCDNNRSKAQSNFCDMEVIFTPDLKAKYKDAIFLITAADIKDIVQQLHESGYTKCFAGGPLLRDFDISQCPLDISMDFAEYALGTCVLCHDYYLNPGQLFLRSVDVIVTERCSLKCKDCSNLMQYYKKPEDCDINQLLQSIDAFCAVVDEVNECRVIGGEPLMNKEFHLIVKRLIDEPKVKKIIIYTNGTIIPNEKQMMSLRNKKVLVFITDYGLLSRNLSGFLQVLEKNDISFFVRKATGWTNCSTIMRHNRSADRLREIYKDCCAKNLVTLSNGKLYRCPFTANAARLSAVPDYKDDYVDLFEEPLDDVNIHEVKNKVREYLLNKEYLETCDYCNGRSLADPEIPPAIQASKPLEYQRYNES